MVAVGVSPWFDLPMTGERSTDPAHKLHAAMVSTHPAPDRHFPDGYNGAGSGMIRCRGATVWLPPLLSRS
jgi:hypothetical protein